MQAEDQIDKTSTEETKQFFLFELEGELYAVLANQVERVMKMPPVTPIPNSPKAIVGVFHLRGRVVVAIDLLGRMGIEKQKPLTANFLFVVHREKNQFAILVDHPRSIVEVPLSGVKPPTPLVMARVPPQYISGVFIFDEIFHSHKKERSIIIGPAGAQSVLEAKATTVHRPVLWLNIEKLFDQEELSQLVVSQEEGV